MIKPQFLSYLTAGTVQMHEPGTVIKIKFNVSLFRPARGDQRTQTLGMVHPKSEMFHLWWYRMFQP